MVGINAYLKNLNRIEFIITYACTGMCKHCSQGKQENVGVSFDKSYAEKVISEVAAKYNIQSVMTFGGEPLLYPEAVCAVHKAAYNAQIPKRQLITNGFFTTDTKKIKDVAKGLKNSEVNDVLLSVDAFHQETIPENIVKIFADEILTQNVPVKLSPAWLVSKNDDNVYNNRTFEIVEDFKKLGISEGEGNVVFPMGNATKYLSEYFDKSKEYINPYEENPMDLKTISIEPDGKLWDENIYENDIVKILNSYTPR